jgi:high-affinity nickel permease
MPIVAVLSLPVVFAAGMSLLDTADGVLMCGAYGWALAHPLRKVFYNLTITGLSAVVAIRPCLVTLPTCTARSTTSCVCAHPWMP